MSDRDIRLVSDFKNINGRWRVRTARVDHDGAETLVQEVWIDDPKITGAPTNTVHEWLLARKPPEGTA